MPTPDYSTNDPKGWGGDPKRGAALGRPTIGRNRTPEGAMTLREVSIDRDGYDCNGTYFGTGITLWWYADESGEIDGVLRARTRTEAKSKVVEMYPTATFRSAVGDGKIHAKGGR